MPFCTDSGVRIYYEVSGEGPPIVLLHPGPFDHSVWLYQVSRFSTFFRVITIDMRGHGRSEDVTVPYGVEDQAEDVLAVLRREGATGVILAGISFSAKVAMLLAADHPEIFSACILVGGSASIPSTNSHEARNARYLKEGVMAVMPSHLRDGTTKDFAASKLGQYILNIFLERSPWLSPMGKVQVSLTRTLNDVTPRLKDIRVPTLVVNGEFDNALPNGRKSAQLIPGAVHKMLPGAGHACCMDDPVAFDAAVIEFLGGRGLMPGQAPRA
jgi:pimeloyl-ACP methyl ester carboxylesterase